MQATVQHLFSLDLAAEKAIDYIVLAGPTGVGKTECALVLAKKFPDQFEIVSVDSVQVYRGLDIGSAKVSREARNIVPHHLIDICAADERYTAARFCCDATEAISNIRQRGKIALVVGGTFLYLQAFLAGLSPLPQVTDSAQEQVLALLSKGLDVAWQKLLIIDPSICKRLNPNDRTRIERALLIFFSTGKALSEWHQLPRHIIHSFHGLTCVILPEDRDALKLSLADRFDQMLSQGLVSEVRSIWDTYPDLSFDHPSMRAIGYRQVSQYLQGQCTYEAMRHDGIIATRRYLKRQLTWLRSMPRIDKIFTGPQSWLDFWD